jgi:glycosyltransferase involved in cell wall biosynthesis
METLQVDIGRYLDRDRYEPTVVPFISEKGAEAALEEFEARLAEVDVPVQQPTEGLGDLTARVTRLLARERFDVVHIQTRTPAASTRLTVAATLARVPALVRTEHVSPGPHIGRWTRYTTLPNNWLTDVVITDSEGDRRQQLQVVGRRADQVIVSYCGIDPTEFDPDHDVAAAKRALGIDPATTVIGNVGRLHEQKGHCHLVAAAATVLEKRSEPLVFLIVGDGPEEEALRAQAEAAGISDHIIWAGFQPDPLPYMQAFDIATMPSLWEGFSISMQQLMAMGKPMVVSDHHSFQEAMVDHEHGLIVPLADPDGLARGLLELLDDTALAARLGRAATARVREEFSIQNHVRELMDLYDGLLERPARLVVAR